MDIFSDIFQYRPGGATSPLSVISLESVAEDGDPPGVRSSPGGATSPLPVTMNKRKYPSRNSVVVRSGNSPVILFVTVCVANRGQRGRCPSLADPYVHKCIVDAWRKADAWIVGWYVIMPDHIHFFCSPKSNPIVPFARWMGYWKRLVAQGFPCNDSCTLGGATSPLPSHKCGNTVFQRSQWDTQLRCGDDYNNKWLYVRDNPVRKGIVERAECWPYQGDLNVLNWHDR